MAQPTGRPRGRPPGSKNKSTLERERKEKEKVLNESRDEIVNEVVKKVEKMVDNKMDVTTPPKGDRGIVLGGFAGTYQKVAQKGQFSLLKSEQFGDRAYMVLLKGKKVVAKDIATMNDARVVKAIGRAHRVRKGGVVEDIVMDLSLITEEIDNQISRIKDISGDVDILDVWDMLESANRLILNASNELESLGIEKSKKGKVSKSKIKKDTYGDNLSPDDEVRVRTINSLARSISNYVNETRRNLLYIADGFKNVSGFNDMKGLARQFGDVGVIRAIEDYQDALVEYANAINDIRIKTPETDDIFITNFEDLINDRIIEFIRGNYVVPRAEDIDETPVDADYDLSQYEIKSKKGSQSKVPVKDDRGSIGIDIEKMIRTKKESKEKPETDPDEPIEAPDEPPVTQGEKPETNPDEPIETPSEPAVSDKGKDDDISSLESSAGPTVIANSNSGSELDIDIDLDDDEDLEKMMARKERMQSQAEPPGRTQPFANNYRTIQMGEGKFNPMDMPKGRNVKP